MGESFAGLRAVARVAIVNQAGELLLCRSRSGKAWVLPGGTLDPGETLSTAAAREAEEEVGLHVHVGPMLFLQEFRPAHRQEHVLEVAFRAAPLQDHPVDFPAEPAGTPDRPWAGWHIQDPDGPRREVRWFSQAQIAALSEPVYPGLLRDRFWQGLQDPYLGLVEG